MSLFGAIQLANNALRAQQIGLQVTGQNIANANTPGYVREEVVLTPAPTQRMGGLLLGLGVQVTGVIQKIDHFLQERLRNAGSDRASSEVQEQAFLQLEELVGELGDTDLSTSLNKFFNSISEILNQPESVTTRNLAVLQGKILAGDLRRLETRANKLRSDHDRQVAGLAVDVNRLIEEIRGLNLRITATEGGEISHSDAVGLRDQRGVALAKLADLISIRVTEQPSGAVNVYAGGEFLVFEGTSRQVFVEQSSDRGLPISTLKLQDINAPVEIASGKIAGLVVARDETLGGFVDQLNNFAKTLAFEFNKVYSSGQGMRGFEQLTSEFAVQDTKAALDAAGLPFTPTGGAFQVHVYNRQTRLTQTTDVYIDLDGLNGNDTTLESLSAALTAIDGVSASVGPDGKLTINRDGLNREIAFGNDTSGVLAALGLNVFFTGSTAGTLGVSQTLLDDPAKFAASRSGIGEGTGGAVELAAFLDRPLATQNGATLSVLYDQLVGNVTQQSSVARAVAQGFRVFEEALHGQNMAISGVSLDEEAVKLITYQRAYQASARYIATISELLEMLVNL